MRRRLIPPPPQDSLLSVASTVEEELLVLEELVTARVDERQATNLARRVRELEATAAELRATAENARRAEMSARSVMESFAKRQEEVVGGLRRRLEEERERAEQLKVFNLIPLTNFRELFYF
jgi:predicted RNase H-like nuclease (RuvC/YqgF family)